METNYKKDFQNFVKKSDLKIEKISSNGNFKVGDIINFTNEFGVKFLNIEILGFTHDKEYLNNREVFINKSSYWFPVRLKEIELAN